MVTRKTGNYDEYHLEWLKDPANAAAFLNSALEDYDSEAFLQALRDVMLARVGMTADNSHACKSSVNNTLSKQGSLKFSSISKLLHGMGLRLTVEPDI